MGLAMSGYSFSGEPTISQVILRKLAQRMEAKRDRRLVTSDRTHMRYQAIVRLMLTLAGFSLLTIAAFSLSITLGFAAAGISCFVLAWLATPSTITNDTSTMDGRR